MKEFNKVKCKLCGKVGVKSMSKALSRHLRLAHNILTNDFDEYFEETDSDAKIDLTPSTKKEFRKSLKPKGKTRKKDISINKTFVRVIYTPMGNKR